MMRRFSLGQRLTLLFILLLLLCAAVACLVQMYSSQQYGNAMVQRLSSAWRNRLCSVNRFWMRRAGLTAGR